MECKMATPRAFVELANLPPWVVDDIISNLPRAAPETTTEAMMTARRMVDPETRPLPREWDKAEAERFGDGYHWETRRTPSYPRRVANEYGDLPADADGMVYLPPKKTRPSPPIKVANQPMQPYPFDADEVRMERRLANARGILESSRQNPDIYNQLPAVFRLPLSDDLIARLAAESPQVVLRKTLQENPEIVGGLLGAAGTLGGGIAYGLLSPEDDTVRAGQ